MIQAINAGRIPSAFQEDLQSRANELVNTVNCPRTEDEGEEPKKDEKDKTRGPPPEETDGED